MVSQTHQRRAGEVEGKSGNTDTLLGEGKSPSVSTFCALFHWEVVPIALCGWPFHTIPFIV